MNLPWFLSASPQLASALGDDVMHLSLVALSVTILTIALLAYLGKRKARYFFLVLAFMFLTISQAVTFFETVWLSNGLLIIPVLGLHLSHVFDLLTLLSFGFALVRSSARPRLNNKTGGTGV